MSFIGQFWNSLHSKKIGFQPTNPFWSPSESLVPVGLPKTPFKYTPEFTNKAIAGKNHPIFHRRVLSSFMVGIFQLVMLVFLGVYTPKTNMAMGNPPFEDVFPI